MSLKPLGFKGSLSPPISLGHKVQLLQTSVPLGQSLSPLAQSLQPLGNSLRSPLLQASFFDREMPDSWFVPDLIAAEDREEVMGTREPDDTPNSPLNSSSSSSQSSITNSPSPTSTVSLAEDKSSSKNVATSSSSNATENVVNLKPLGISKPLAQNPNLLISNQSELSQVIQNKSIDESLLVSKSEAENPDPSAPKQIEAVSPSSDTKVAEQISLKPDNSNAESELSDLPKINTIAQKDLSFNKQLISPSIAASLEKPQSDTQETPNPGTVKASWHEPNLEKSATTLPLQSSTSPDTAASSIEPVTDISPSLETSILKQTAASQKETPVQTKENFVSLSSTNTLTNSSETTHDTATTPQNLVSPTIETATTVQIQETVTPHEKIVSSNQKDAIASPVDAPNVPVAPNLLQPTRETPTPFSTPQTLTLQEESSVQRKEDFATTSPTATTGGELIGDTTTVPNVPAPPNLISPATGIPAAPTQEVTSAQPKEDFTSTSAIANQKTDVVDDATAAPNKTESHNLVSPKREASTVIPTQEIVALKEETFSSDKKDLAGSSQAEVTSDKVSVPNAPTSPNVISPTTETPTATPDAALTQPATFAQAKEEFGFISPKSTETEAITPALKDIVSPTSEIPNSTGDLSVASTGSKSKSDKLIPTSPSIIQPNRETVTPISTQEIRRTPEENVTSISAIANQKTDVGDDATTTPNQVESLNLVTPSRETSTAIPSPETAASQETTFSSNQEKLATSSPMRSHSETNSGEMAVPNAPASPDPISPITETATATSVQQALVAQPEPLVQAKEDLGFVPTATETEAITAPPKNVLSPTDSSDREDVTASSAIAPSQAEEIGDTNIASNTVSSLHTIQPKLEPPTAISTPETVAPQLKALVEPKEDLASASPTTTSEALSETITSSQPNLVQSRLENSSLDTLKPLGFSKPLVQRSELVNPGLMADFIDESTDVFPVTSPSDSSLSQQISRVTEGNLSDSSSSTEVESPNFVSENMEKIPDSEKSISQMEGESPLQNTDKLVHLKPLGFSNSLNSTNNFILPKLDLSPASGEAPKTIGFDEPPNSPHPVKDVPNSWSNISELLGENSTPEERVSKKEDESSPLLSLIKGSSDASYSLLSQLLSSPPPSNVPDSSPLDSNELNSENIIAEDAVKNSSDQDEQLDIIAQKVYTLMRQWLEISQERHGKKCVGQPIWISNITSIYGTSAYVKAAPKRASPGQKSAADFSEVSPVDDQLQQLTRKVYWQIQQRVEIARERQGHYYTGCLPW